MSNITPDPFHGPSICVTLISAWSTIIDWVAGKHDWEAGESRIPVINNGNDCAIPGCALS